MAINEHDVNGYQQLRTLVLKKNTKQAGRDSAYDCSISVLMLTISQWGGIHKWPSFGKNINVTQIMFPREGDKGMYLINR